MGLSIDQLAALGYSPEAVETWRRNGIKGLLPLQEKAVADHAFLHGKSLLVFAPTSSGKTFVAELAALRHLERNRRVIYLVPTKALAEEKYREFSALYGPLGYRIAVATRERPQTDKIVLNGRYDLLVAVYEKMKAYLVARPELLSSVALVVADEIQMLGEAGRGGTLDLLLTKIGKSPYGTQLIGLSAVLGEDAQRLADWLKSDLMVYRQRPVELREGVFDLSNGKFTYRNFNEGDRGEEILDAGRERLDGDAAEYEEEAYEEEDADFRRDGLLALAGELAAGRGEQVLVFVPTRYMSRNWAHHLASRVDLPEADGVLEEIGFYEETHSRELLEEVLRHGVAFHNADLSWDLRGLVEEHFNAGGIRILVSTSTLGQGVNLKGRNVLHVPAMVQTDPWTGRHSMTALSRGRFRNQGGRGARFSHESQFGRSILAVRNATEGERLMRDYVEGELEPLQARLSPDSLDVYVLDLTASRVATDREGLVDFFHDTFSGRTLWRKDSTPVARRIDGAVESLMKRGFLKESKDGGLEATGLGEVAAATGLAPATVGRIVDWLREGPRAAGDDPAEALAVLAATVDGREFPAGNVGRGGAAEVWVEGLRERLLHRTEGVASAIREFLSPEGGFTREMLGDVKKVAVLDAWIGPGETREIEERYGMYSGTVANLASHFGWLAQGAAALAGVLMLPGKLVAALEELGERLALGCGPEGLVFRSLRVQGFSRAYLQALLREGYDSPESLVEAGEEALSNFLPQRIARNLVEEAARALALDAEGNKSVENKNGKKKRKNGSKTNGMLNGRRKSAVSKSGEKDSSDNKPDNPPGKRPGEPGGVGGEEDGILLEVDTRGTGRARLRGKELGLSRLEFRLLTALARSPRVGVSYEEIEAYVWPDAHVERQQLLAHRAGVVRRFSEVIPPSEAKELIAVKKGVGMILALDPARVRVVEH